MSAEAYGMWNRKQKFTPVVLPKSEEDRIAIYEKLNQSFMFNALSEKEKAIVVDAMEEVQVP